MSIDRSKQKTLPWFPNAVATKLGWVDPDKGELLVSIRGLPKARKWEPKTNTFDPPLKAKTETVAEVTPEAVEAATPEPKAPAKKPAVKKAPVKKAPAKKTPAKKPAKKKKS